MNRFTHLPNVYFCNPGEYCVTLSINIQTNCGYSIDARNTNQIMPQNQMPAIQYGNGHHFAQGHAYIPFSNNNGYEFPRPASSSSILDESSYSSGISTPGIVSDSWSYASPHQISPNHTVGRDQSQLNPAYFNESMNNGFKTSDFQATSTPTKGGCFSVKNCAII